MRTYVYSNEKLHSFFGLIVNRLSDDAAAHSDMIQTILKDICVHFRFGRGLVYEADHTGVFELKEFYSVYQDQTPPAVLKLDEALGLDQMAELLAGRTIVIQLNPDEEETGCGSPAHFLRARSVLLTPVLADGDKLVGLVAMFDRRHQILLDNVSIKAAQTVLKLVANHVRLRAYQMRLEYARKSLADIMDNLGIDIYVNDYETHEILYLNRSMAAPYGGLERMLGQKCWQALYDDKTGECEFCPREKLVDENGQPTRVYSWDYRRPFDGSWFRVLSAAFPWVDGRLAHVISSIDITANKRNEETIYRLANFDEMTKLFNRRKMLTNIEESLKELAGAEGDRREAWLIFFDIDNFKLVNDTYGHQAGDELLEQIGWTLSESPLTQNYSYRFGGDEFAVFRAGIDRTHLNRILDFLMGVFSGEWVLKGGERFYCRASFGISHFPDDGQTTDILIRQADLAMYQAKHAGRGQAVFAGQPKSGC